MIVVIVTQSTCILKPVGGSEDPIFGPFRAMKSTTLCAETFQAECGSILDNTLEIPRSSANDDPAPISILIYTLAISSPHTAMHVALLTFNIYLNSSFTFELQIVKGPYNFCEVVNTDLRSVATG